MNGSGWVQPVKNLLETAPQFGLVRGDGPTTEARQILRAAEPGNMFRGARAPEAAVGGLWLLHGGWEEAHTIVQDLGSAEGSYWHAIVHRIEPDSFNSRYWFSRVGRHPVFEALATEAVRLCSESAGASFAPPPQWDPAAFIRYCDEVRGRPGSAEHALAVAIQETEWRLLFEYCARANMV